MIQIGKIDMYVRGGPELPDESLPGETAGQFDSLLNALVVMPGADTAQGESPVPNDSDWTGSANDSVQPWRGQPNDLPETKSGIDLSVDHNPEQPGILDESPPLNGETAPEPGTDKGGPVLDAPEPTPNKSGFPQITQRMDILTRAKNLHPRIDGKSVDIDQKVETKNPLPGDTPPIILGPNDRPPVPPYRPPIRVQGVPINEFAPRNSSPNDVKTDASESTGILDEPQVVAVNSDNATGETKSDLGSGGEQAHLHKEVRLETGKISDAIFEKFAVDADKAIRASDFELASEAEPLIEQIEKPILEVSSGALEEGEPIFLKFRLKPAELGSVEIRLEKNSAGHLDVEIQTESEHATHALKESFEQLRESLKDSGWKVEDINIFNRPSSDQTLHQQQRGTDSNHASGRTAPTRNDSSETTSDSETPADHAGRSAERLVSIRA